MISPHLGKTIALFLGMLARREAHCQRRLRMKVTVNGTPCDVGDAETVLQIVEHLGLTDGPVAVEVNREIVPRAEHASFKVKDGDVLEIVHFVGGG